jgi:hypothetical protein
MLLWSLLGSPYLPLFGGGLEQGNTVLSTFWISLIADVGPRSNTHADETHVVEGMDFKT